MLVQNTIYKIIYNFFLIFLIIFFNYFTTFYAIYVCPTLQRLSVTFIVFR